TDSWTYAPAGLNAALMTGRAYVLQVRAVDRAGNVQSVFEDEVSSLTFVCDKSSPTTTITVPAHNTRYKPADLTSFSGTGADDLLPFAPEQLNKVQYNLSYLHEGVTWYWTGSDFSDSGTEESAWANVLGTENWTKSFTGTWVSDRQYTFMTRAFDKAEPVGANGGNMQDPPTISTFVVDGTPPVSRVSTPAAGAFIPGDISQISGTSFAGISGLSELKLKVYFSTGTGADTWYWGGTGWSSGSVVAMDMGFSVSAGTITWNYAGSPVTISTNNQVYYMSIAGLDLAGNQETVVESSVRSDFNYPTVSISTPMAGAYGFYSGVRPITTMRGNAYDTISDIVPPLKAQLSRMLPSRNVEAMWDGTDWGSYTSTYVAVNSISPWDMTTPQLLVNKRYSVEMLSVDNAGNATPTGGGAGSVYGDFIYDVNAPTSSIA
ncbi:MAG: hypothetical protein COT18_02525, partial [Elusimicrobia bacterium CG08_land_8_20_14_0_20_59_10]